MSDSNIRSVVVFTPYKWEHALLSLRIIRPLQQAGITLICGNIGMDLHPERVQEADAVVLQREFPENLEVYEQILTLARSAKKPIIYEIDDLLFDLPENHIDAPTHYYSRALFAMLRAAIEADLVTVSSAPLADYMRRFNPSVQVLPNYLDDNLWPLRSPRQIPNAEDGSIREVVIGYMGSNTHLPDLEPLAPLLVRMLERYPQRLRLRFWSVEPPALLRQHPQVEWVPITLHNYAEFAGYFSTQSCDIFIAPLNDSEFNRCKSSVKYFEYSALGIPGVYSRTTPYAAVIQDGQNGLLASTEQEWEERLSALVESPDLRVRIGNQALQTTQQHWLLSQHAAEWPRAYQTARQTAQDVDAQRTRASYLEIIISIANQVRGWQNKLVGQIIEQEMIIQTIQHDLAEQSKVIADLQAQIAAREGLIEKVIKRLDRKLMQTARQLRKTIDR